MKVFCAYCRKELERKPCRTKGRNYCNASHQMAFEYKFGIRNKEMIIKNAHKRLDNKIEEGTHPFQIKRNNLNIVMQTPEYKEKCRNAKLGDKNPMFGKTGENHHLWKGGKIWWRGKDWEDIKKIIKEMDDYMCLNCSRTEHENINEFGQPMAVHHLVKYRISRDNSPSNLLTACNVCHGLIESKEV